LSDVQQPSALTVQIRRSNIEIRNTKKRYPMCLKIADLTMGDGPKTTASYRDAVKQPDKNLPNTTNQPPAELNK